jgi:predicted xylose isomerase-like sugar epimerase
METGQCVFIRIPPGWVQDPSPQRQLVVCVSGAARFRGSDEATHVLPAGESLIDANTEGLVHVSEVISDVPFEAYLLH